MGNETPAQSSPYGIQAIPATLLQWNLTNYKGSDPNRTSESQESISELQESQDLLKRENIENYP